MMIKQKLAADRPRFLPRLPMSLFLVSVCTLQFDYAMNGEDMWTFRQVVLPEASVQIVGYPAEVLPWYVPTCMY